jgi:hypothetical protein
MDHDREERERDIIALATTPIVLDEMYTIDEAEDALFSHIINSHNTQCINSSQEEGIEQ